MLCLGLSPTYRVQPKPRWQSAAAQYTLSSGPRRGKVRIHALLFTRVEVQCGCYLDNLANLYSVGSLFFLCFCLYRWFYWDSPQCFPLAIPYGVCCGIWGLHFIIWHTADSSLWPGGQHSLSHTEWPYMVKLHPLVSALRFHVFLSFAGINWAKCPWVVFVGDNRVFKIKRLEN